MKYEVIIADNLREALDMEDDFEEKSDNVATVQVYDAQGQNVTKETRHVMLSLSRNGLLGLGTELIRLAHEFHVGKHWHLEPATSKNKVQTMGVFVTPDSCELIICCDEGKCIDDYLK